MTHATHLPTTPLPAQPAASRQPMLDRAHELIEELIAATGRATRDELDRYLAQALIDTKRAGYDEAAADFHRHATELIDQRTSLAAERRTRAVRYLSEPDGVQPAARELDWAGRLSEQAATVRSLLR